MAAVEDDLGRHVLGGAAERPGLVTLWDHLGEAKVHHFDVALGIQKQVLGLEIPIDDALAVQVVWKKVGKSLEPHQTTGHACNMWYTFNRI